MKQQDSDITDHSRENFVAEASDISLRNRVRGSMFGNAIGMHKGREVVNSSKGSSGVTHVYPVGIYGAVHHWPLAKTASEAGEMAKLPHSQSQSIYAYAALAVIVQQCLCADHVDRDVFKTIVAESLKTVGEVYGESDHMMQLFKKTIEESERLLGLRPEGWPDDSIIEFSIGAGWIAEEALAIAVFSVLRYIDDFEACIECAVNHAGDSCSTGEVAGNIIGAIVGYDAIPQKFIDPLQLRDAMLDMSDKLSSRW